MDKNSSRCYGLLYIVATPIGNLKDITYRAIEILQSVDAILVEDTRHSSKLLAKFAINKQLIPVHAHNEHAKTQKLLAALKQGKSYALISDAGTPLINDPGFDLVRAAQQQGITVVPIPGACAIIAALSAAGVPCDIFTFAGFLSTKQSSRLQQLIALRAYNHTIVLYESTHRVLSCIADIATIYGDDYTFIMAKELTKVHEFFVNDTAIHIRDWLLAVSGRCNGEFVLILPPALLTSNLLNDDYKLLEILLSELSLKQAIQIASKLSVTTKNALYKLGLVIQNAKPC